MIEAWVDRFYQRHRRHYFLWWHVLAHVLLQVIAQSFVPFYALVAELDMVQYLRLAGGVALFPVMIPVQYSVTVRTFGTQAVPFLRDQPVEAALLWKQMIRGPRNSSLFSLASGLPLLVSFPWLVHGRAPGSSAILAWIVFGVLSGAAITSLWVTGNRVFARPLLADIARTFPDVVGTITQSSVNSSLLLSLNTTVLGATILGVGVTTGVTDANDRLLLASASIIAASAYAMGLFRVLNGTPTVRPLVDLTRAATAVADGDLDHTVPITSEDELGRLGQAFNRMTKGLRDRARLQAAFGSYVDPGLADRLLEQGDDLFRGETVEVTVLFLDVRDFTAWTETHEATDVVARLNRLFTLAVPIIRQHGGHANKFLGDGVLAVFGTPEANDDHADRAVRASLELLAAVRTTFGDDLRIGIGMDTGKVVAGTIGGGGKLEFTLIGDTVNVAARVEELTKEFDLPLLLTSNTVDALTHPPADLRTLGDVPIRGKAAPVELHGSMGDDGTQ